MSAPDTERPVPRPTATLDAAQEAVTALDAAALERFRVWWREYERFLASQKR